MYIIYYLLCITFTEYVHMFCSPFAEKNTISTFSDGGQNLLNTHTSDICNFHRQIVLLLEKTKMFIYLRPQGNTNWK